MKKKILIIILIIVVSFILGICMHTLTTHFETKNINEPIEKERLFNITNIPVSNSEYSNNKVVFKSFYAYNNELNLNEFTSNNEFYFKKVVTYSEYQKYKDLIPELRTLTEDDFVHYYLIIVLSQDIEHIYTFEEYKINDDSMDLMILKNKILSSPDSTPSYSGVAIVLPNVSDFPEEKINTINASN